MLDPYAKIAEVDPRVQRKLSESLELRAADQEMRTLVTSYLSRLNWSEGMEILEVGCGTGAITRLLAQGPGVRKVTGIDPSAIFIEKANELGEQERVEFVVGDGRELPFADQSFDVVVFHTVLGHVPSPEHFLLEAKRVLKKGGQIAIFDGDYAMRSVAIGEDDPIQVCVEIMKKHNTQNPWLVRQLPAMLAAAGFTAIESASHPYLGKNPDYLLNYIERGADRLADLGRITKQTAAALKEEAHQRVRDGRFFGLFPFMSFLAISE